VLALVLALTCATPAEPTNVRWMGPTPAQAPRRIVSLTPSLTEILFAIGAGPQVVGVTRFDDYPAEVQKLPRVGGLVDLSLEAVLALSPDLVVAMDSRSVDAPLRRLADLGLSVLVLRSDRFEDLDAIVPALGKVTRHEDGAAAVLSAVRRELGALASAHASKRVQRVLLVVSEQPLVVAGKGSFIDGVLRHVALTNVVQSGGEFPEIGLESVFALDPDVIVDLTYGEQSNVASRFAETRAGRAGRIVRVRDDALLRLTPRLPSGLAAMARAVHRSAP
jgi:iron complex transport system substrate-binding protein